MVSAQYSAVTPDFMTLKLSLEMKWKLQVVPTSAVPIMCLLFNIWVQFHTAFMIPCVSGFNLFQTFYSPLKYFGYFIPLTAPEFHHGCCGEMAMPQDEEAVKSHPPCRSRRFQRVPTSLLVAGRSHWNENTRPKSVASCGLTTVTGGGCKWGITSLEVNKCH